MKILVTGYNGFIGKNLVAELKNKGYTDLLLFGRENTEEQLSEYAGKCRFVFHLAGVNRPEREEEFWQGNKELTRKLLDALTASQSKAPVLMTSSIQAECSNPYGASKRESEELLFSYEKKSGNQVYAYRLPNVFGKWSRPDYNSVIATFCHHISRHEEITVSSRENVMNLVYIDDVVNELIAAMEGKANRIGAFCQVPVTYQTTLGWLADTLYSFQEGRNNLQVPDMGNELEKKLYSTWLSYLPENAFSYALNRNTDDRGSFTEFIRTANRGQVSVNVSKPGVVKGNHWHNTKNEKFLVVKGQGVIRFRKVGSNEVIEYPVSGERLEVVDIPVGYTHNIENTGMEDMITVMWANEAFDPNHPDTWYEEV